MYFIIYVIIWCYHFSRSTIDIIFNVIIFPSTCWVLSFMLSFDVIIYCYHFRSFFFFLKTWHTRCKNGWRCGGANSTKVPTANMNPWKNLRHNAPDPLYTRFLQLFCTANRKVLMQINAPATFQKGLFYCRVILTLVIALALTGCSDLTFSLLTILESNILIFELVCLKCFNKHS